VQTQLGAAVAADEELAKARADNDASARDIAHLEQAAKRAHETADEAVAGWFDALRQVRL